jgi:hypothetical protein
MQQRRFQVEEDKSRIPILIVDARGIIGGALAFSLASEFLPVFLTNQRHLGPILEKVIMLPLGRKAPRIPDNIFSHFFIVHNGIPQDNLLTKALSHEAQRRNIPLVIVCSAFSSFLATPASQKVIINRYMFFYGDIVDDAFDNLPSKLLQEARESGSLTLPDRGLFSIYPSSLEHVVSSIIRVLFVDKSKPRSYFLFHPSAMTGLTFARMVQQINPLLRINFLNKKLPARPIFFSDNPVFLPEKREDLRKNIKAQILRSNQKSNTNKYRSQSKKRTRNWFMTVVGGIMLFFTPLLFALLLFASGWIILFQAEASLYQLETQQARKQSRYALTALEMSRQVIAKYELLAKGKHLLYPLVNNLNIGITGAETIDMISEGLDLYKLLFLAKRSVDSESFVQATQSIKNGLIQMNVLTASSLFPQNKPLHTPILYRKLYRLFVDTSEVLPQVLGFDKKMKYLVLLQNNNELRPGGGFIGSYGIFEIKNGQVEGLRIHDVYDADGQLKGHVEPPFFLKRHMGIQHWYLRDSNAAVDFLENARLATTFLRLETGEKVDGVIALDTFFIKQLLSLLGPVKLQGYPSITAENFDNLAQDAIQDNFFPGSTTKKTLLTSVYNELMRKLFSADQATLRKILRVINDSFAQKHLLVGFVDPAIQAPFSLQGISSTLLPMPHGDDSTIQDFIGVNEANVGANKVNPYIKRSFVYAVEVGEKGEVKTKVKLTLANTSQQEKYAGEYKVYLRFILPKDVSPSEIELDGIRQVILTPLISEEAYSQRGAVAQNSLEVERIDEKHHTVYGFLVVVPKQTKKTISLTYLSGRVKNPAKTTYELRLFKQPGTGADPYLFSFHLPKDYQVFAKPDFFTQKGNTITGLSFLDSDKSMIFSFGKK